MNRHWLWNSRSLIKREEKIKKINEESSKKHFEELKEKNDLELAKEILKMEESK